MQIKEPSVGPIVGATTDTMSRVFIRGELELSGGVPRRAHGVARIREQRADAVFGKVHYFKLNPNFDITGVAIFEGLRAETEYEYQIGWIFSEVDSDQIDVSTIIRWDLVKTFRFRTAASDSTRERSFIVGSCRYLLRLFGGTWFDSRGDKTFGSIVQQIEEQDRRTDAVLMIGDQIYADDLNVLRADTSVDTYFKRYRDAFTTECIRSLMARVPTYMTLDDHEIEDNWPSKANERDFVLKFPAAIHAYQTYQLSHSPLLPVKNGKLDGTPDFLFYSFRDGCVDFFIADTRTERSLRPDRRQIIGPRQWEALTRWLADGSGRVKVIATAVPPFAVTGDDKWEGFVEQRDHLLDFILANRIPRVVFISGDVHASFTARLRARTDPAFQVLSVVSSSFFWPYPHPPRGVFQSEGTIRSESQNGYFIESCSEVHPEDNFTRLTVTLEGVRVEVFQRKGDLLSLNKYHFSDF